MMIRVSLMILRKITSGLFLKHDKHAFLFMLFNRIISDDLYFSSGVVTCHALEGVSGCFEFILHAMVYRKRTSQLQVQSLLASDSLSRFIRHGLTWIPPVKKHSFRRLPHPQFKKLYILEEDKLRTVQLLTQLGGSSNDGSSSDFLLHLCLKIGGIYRDFGGLLL